MTVTTARSRAGGPGTPVRRAGRPAALILVGLAVATAVPAVPGKLLLLDVLCLVALPLLLVTILHDRRLGVLVLVTSGWAAGQVMADMANGLPLRTSQGLVTAVTIVAVTAALVRLSADVPVWLRLLLAAMMVGSATGQLVFYTVPVWSAAGLWKYVLGIPVSVAVLALCDLRWHAGSRYPTFLALAGLVAVDLLLDFRSLALATLFTLVLYAVAVAHPTRLRGPTIVAGAVFCALLVPVFFAAAGAGWLGQRSALQFKQDAGNVYAIMVNARPEAVQSIYLISRRPLTGYGSQPRLNSETFTGSLQFVAAHGVAVGVNLRRGWLRHHDPGVAQHSMMLDATVMTGVLALPFWMFVLTVAVRRAVRAIGTRASPLSVFWTLLVFWNVLFSPLTGLYHAELAAYLALVLLPLPAGTDERVPR